MTRPADRKAPRPYPARPFHVRPLNAGRLPLLGMDAEVWRRHASGWSVWTRFATLPVFFLAIWSHQWLGWLAACGLVALVVVWLWLNPRIFPAPKRFDSWHARATFGERIWLNRAIVPIPAAEARLALALSLVTGTGFVLGTWGAIENALTPTVAGGALTYAGKLAFLNRMARLYDRMRDAHPVYRSWSRIPDNDNSGPLGRRSVS